MSTPSSALADNFRALVGVGPHSDVPVAAFARAFINPKTGAIVAFIDSSGALVSVGGSSSGMGYLGIPQTIVTANYATLLADAGKCIYHPASHAGAVAVTLSKVAVTYPIGTVIQFLNMSAGDMTIVGDGDTLITLPDGSTGNVVVSQYGLCFAERDTAGTWVFSGNSQVAS